MASIYRKLTEAGVDKKDIEIMWELAKEKEFSEEEYTDLAKKVGIETEDAKKRIKKLRDKKILLKDRVSILNQVKVWDGYYIVLVKAAIQPPVIGMETKFPVGWVTKDYLNGLRQIEKEMKIDIVRHAYILQGIEWDIMLVVSAKSQNQLADFFTRVSKQGWVSKVWSFTPLEWREEWIFDPIAAPNPNVIIENNTSAIQDSNE